MSEKVVVDAITAFRERRFLDALVAFERAARRLGAGLFEHNIRLCLRELSAAESPTSGDPVLAANSWLLKQLFDVVYWVYEPDAVGHQFALALSLRFAGLQFIPVEIPTSSATRPRVPANPALNHGAQNVRSLKNAMRCPSLEAAPLVLTKIARSQGAHKILILRGNVVLCKSFATNLTFLMSSVASDWQIVSLANPYGRNERLSEASVLAGYVDCEPAAVRHSAALALRLSAQEPQTSEPAQAGEISENADWTKIPMFAAKRCYLSSQPLVLCGGRSDNKAVARIPPFGGNFTHEAVSLESELPLPLLGVRLAAAPRKLEIERLLAETAAFADVRLFCDSVDGPRPLHSADGTGCTTPEPPVARLKTDMFSVDFLVTPESGTELSSKALQDFLEHELFGAPARGNLRKSGFVRAKNRKSLVSIIIPTFCRPERLNDALRSVLGQNYPLKEVIVVSDNEPGGSDAVLTADFVNKARADYPNVEMIYIQHTHTRNGAAARNTGLLHARGEYICFLDDDDIYLPGRLSSSIAVLEGSPNEVGAVYCGYLGWNSADNDLARYPEGNLSREILTLDYESHYLHTNTVTYKRSALDALNGFDESFMRHQDLELNLRFFQRFRISAAPILGVQLNPRGKLGENEVLGLARFDLKEKFFRKFSALFQSYENQLQSLIVERHLQDCMRLITDRHLVLNYLEHCEGSVILSKFLETILATSKS